MGWLSSLTDFVGLTNTGMARDAQTRADEAQAKAEKARLAAEAEAKRIADQKAVYEKNLSDIAAQQTTDVNTAALSNVVAGGAASAANTDLLKKKKVAAPTLSSQLGINL